MIRSIFLILLCSAPTFIFGQSPFFELEGQRAPAGEKLSFKLPVRSPDGDSTYLPITVIHGKKPGPVLGLIAGVHGYEYPPIIALQGLPSLLDPAAISGTVVIVHIANVQAFLGRSIYYNPADHKNLNRVFPGRDDGTITECIAWTISRKLFPHFDYFVDVHAGDGSEDLHPYVGYVVSGKQTAAAKKMAEAMGFDWIMRAERNITAGVPTQYSTSEAVAQGIPAVAIECGKQGIVTREDIAKINGGLLNMMRALEMLSGEAKPPQAAINITKRITINSRHSGIFYSDRKSGQLISKGMQLGYVTDLWGRRLEDIISPVDGFIVYMISTPPINEGELLFNLAVYP